MSFHAALRATPGLENAYRPGLRALGPHDRGRVRAENSRDLTGSANVDAALAAAWANAPRWDYAIARRATAARGDFVYWVEVHPAHTAEVSSVLSKLAWLKSWLAGSAPLLGALPRQFIWVATGPVKILAGSPQARVLAKSGLRPPVGQLSIG